MHIAASISLNSKPSVTQSVRKIEHQKNEIESRFSGSSERGNSRSASSGVLARSETDIQVSPNTALCTSLPYLTFDFVILCLLSAILYCFRSADFQISPSTRLSILIPTDDRFDLKSEGEILLFKQIFVMVSIFAQEFASNSVMKPHSCFQFTQTHIVSSPW